jgi:uncharacterized repeat protein (TIGR01451 family)
VNGPLRGWNELDYVPMRVTLQAGGQFSSQVVTINFDHMKGGTVPGLEDLTGFTPSSNATITAGPTLSAPTGSSIWSYTFTVTMAAGGTGDVEFFGRLAAGSHGFTGSSLNLKCQSSNIQIQKPGALLGSPDLALTKVGPSQAKTNQIITYAISYTNKLVSTTNAIGVQVSDVFPPQVTYVPGSASKGAYVVGNTIFWDLGTLKPGASGFLTYKVVVTNNLAVTTTFANYAQILYAQDDANPADNTSSVTTTVVITPSPVAADDHYVVDVNGFLSVPAPGVLLNDTNVVSATLFSAPLNGTLSFNPNGSFTYAPAPNFVGTDTFVYRAVNGTNLSGPAVVTIDVTNSCDFTVSSDLVVTNEPGKCGAVVNYPAPVTTGLCSPVICTPPSGAFFPVGTVAVNCTNANGISRSFLVTVVDAEPPVISTPANITVNVDHNSPMTNVAFTVTATDNCTSPVTNLVSTPPSGSTFFAGVTTVTNTAVDNAGNVSQSTFTVTVLTTNAPPAAQNQGGTIPEGASTNLVVTASDVDDGNLVYAILTGTAHGSLGALNPTTGAVTYSAPTNYVGLDAFTFTAFDGSLYATGTVSLVVTPTVQWTPLSPITYGTPLGSNQLDATSTAPGTYVYAPASGAVLPVGTNTIGVVFTPADTNYLALTQSVQILVVPATLTVSPDNKTRPYAQPNPALTYSVVGFVNGENASVISGAPALSTTANLSSPMGTFPISAAQGTLAASNYTFTYGSGALTVTAGSDAVNWTPLSPIVYGTPLGANQLDATATVAGSFAYSPTNGAVLPVGTNTLDLVFTPDDTNYPVVNLSVPLLVDAATLTVTADNLSRQYALPNPVLTGSITGLQNGDAITAVYATTATISSPIGTYPIVPSLVDSSNQLVNYTVVTNSGTLTVTAGSDAVNWTPASPITYGTPLGASQLNATATVPGTFAYSPASGAVLPAGMNTLSVVFTPTDTNYPVVNLSVPLAVNPATLTITPDNKTRAYAQPNPALTYNVSGFVNGENASVISGAPALATTANLASSMGIYPINSAQGTLVASNYTFTYGSGTLTVTAGSDAVNWTPLSPIVYGTPLGTNQLNATATVPGAFAYSPANGAVLLAGTNTLSVAFTPTDTNYPVVNLSVPLAVNPATLTVTADNLSRQYAQPNPVLTGSLNGLQNGDVITANYTTTATISSPMGTYPIVPSLVDASNQLVNYTVVTNSGTLTVTAGSDAVNWTPASPITYGTPLGAAQLNATATVPGTFAYSPASGAVLPAGGNSLSVVFTPTDTNYPVVNLSVPLVVNPATLTITPNNKIRAYAQPNPTLTYSVTGFVNGENASVISGAPALSTTATITSPMGTYPISAAQGTLAASNYSFTYGSGTLTVTAGSDSVNWTPASPIVYGTPLGAGQLNAAATVPGTFAYSPASGAVLPVGMNTLSVAFTPTDTNYPVVNLSVPLVVNPATLTITPNNKSRVYAQPNPSLTYGVAGFVNGETSSVISGAPALSTTATLSSPVGTYPINSGQGTLAANNYTFTYGSGALTVTPASDAVNWTPASPITYGTPLSASQLNAAATVPGTFAYNRTLGVVLPAGMNTLSVVFTPTDTNYPVVNLSVPLVVNPAMLTITPNNAARAYAQPNPAFTYSVAGFVNGENASVLSGTPVLSTTATLGSPMGTYPINSAQGTLVANNYSFAYGSGIFMVTNVAPPVLAIRQGTSSGTNVFDPQTGLYFQTVTITNVSGSTVAAFRLLVGDIRGTNGVLRTDVQLWNASGTNTDSRPYFQYNSPVNPGGVVTVQMEFYNPSRLPFTNSLEAVACLPQAAASQTDPVVINRAYPQYGAGQPGFALEWQSIPGRTYTIIYSDDQMRTWMAATPTVLASGTVTEWSDDGQPKTVLPPSVVGCRVYRIILNQ